MSSRPTTTTTTNEPPPPPSTKHNIKKSEAVAKGREKAGPMTTCGFKLPKRRSSILHPGKFFRRIGAKLLRSTRMAPTTKQRSSGSKVSSSSTATLVRSRSCADPITDNSHRAQAVEDCIQFFNSSSSQTLSYSSA